ncbi:MAG: hypothetical protein VYA60_04915 [Pseudomonadota bacterium]|nr:hypothetical protein [Pseudomonadota bacterium]
MGIPEKILRLAEFFGDRVLMSCAYDKEVMRKASAIADIIESMPTADEQDNKGDEALAYLHYEINYDDLQRSDWYITERDVFGSGQIDAYGMACMGDKCIIETGYINLKEILSVLIIDIDLNFTPTSIGDIKKELKANGRFG